MNIGSIKRFFMEKLPERVVTQNSAFLIQANALTFTLSAAAQAVSVTHNKELPEEDRKFIFRQEIIKGILDIAVFIGIAVGFKNLGAALVAKGKFLPKELCGEKNREKIRACVIKYMDYAKTAPKGSVTPKEFSHEQENAILTHLSGAKMWTSFAGTIIAFNIITPFMKNYFAHLLDKKKTGKTAKNVDYMSKPAGLDINKFKQFDEFQKKLL